jgi:thiol-disulfide isomerase/thioredoxin
MEKYKKIGISIFLLIVFNGIALAQQEIPDNIKDKIANGIKLLENSKVPEDMDKAVKEFTEAAAIAPEYADVHYYLGKTLAMMQGNAGKAVKEFKKYLELYPDAPDKEKVSKQIAELEKVIKTKNQSYLMGVSLVELPDGIYVRQVSPNYPSYGRRGVPIKVGDKIVKINNVDIKGYSIQSVIKLIDEDTASNNEPRKITIIRGGESSVLLMYKRNKNFNPLIKDLREQDLSALITETKMPMVVFFVSDWCELCDKYYLSRSMTSPIIKYKNSIAFIIANIDEGTYLSEEFDVSKTPAIYLYKEGKLFDKIVGYDAELFEKKVEALMK